jgi:hypothetical protein
MSINQHDARDAQPTVPEASSEQLERSAHNFLVDVILAAQKAEELGLLKPAEGMRPERGEAQSMVAFVASPSNHLGSILISSHGGKRVYALRTSTPTGLYSRHAGVTHESITVSDDYKELLVKVHEIPAKGEYPVHTEKVEDIARSHMLESFASNLRPISDDEHMHIFNQQSLERARHKVTFGMKIAKLLGFGHQSN